MSTLTQKIIKPKLGLLELAKQLIRLFQICFTVPISKNPSQVFLTEQATTSQTPIQSLRERWRAFSRSSSKVFCIFLTTQKISPQPSALELPQICEVRCV